MDRLIRRRRLWLTIGVVTGGVTVAALLLPLAVPTTVIAPARPSEPLPVFLVDYGRTPALVLPLDENRMVAYVYGDWNYYALRNQGAADSVAALLWPTQGALGRREIAGQPTAEAVRRGIGSEVEEIHTLRVDRLRVVRLRRALDSIHEERLETAVSAYGMTFVHHPQPYTHWSNSNHMTAAWMKALGCEIRGPATGSWWRARTAE
jgi:hypothetical protein